MNIPFLHSSLACLSKSVEIWRGAHNPPIMYYSSESVPRLQEDWEVLSLRRFGRTRIDLRHALDLAYKIWILLDDDLKRHERNG